MEAILGALIMVVFGIVAGMVVLCYRFSRLQTAYTHLTTGIALLSQNDQGIAKILIQHQAFLNTKVLLKDDTDEGFLERMN